MVAQALSLMETVFGAVIGWFTDIMDSIEGSGILLAAFMIVLVVSVLFIPLRGNGLGSIGSGVSDFSQHVMHKEKKGYFSQSRNHKQQELKREMNRNR